MKAFWLALLLLLVFAGAGFLIEPPQPAGPVSLNGDWSDGRVKISVLTEGNVLRISHLDEGQSLTFVPGGRTGQWVENPPQLKVPRRLEWKSATAELELSVIDDSNAQSVVLLKKVP